MNQKNSVYLGIAELIVLVIMIILAAVNHAWPAWPLQWVAILATVVTAYINFKNKFETNDDWKTWTAAAAILITISIYAIPIGIHYNHTH